ncbi:hypothetical protein [Nakamurella leprariae]|uniref:Uncharacterized protein n=1 Tax=Nakamurella leprariae TaxID=2803911 RepID=A0A939BXU8_9ACTN|nr:hypothetical protein [Nakamurella leprariae]MBM9466375.1 hypothetical protein [Nakamurella leprariae]
MTNSGEPGGPGWQPNDPTAAQPWGEQPRADWPQQAWSQPGDPYAKGEQPGAPQYGQPYGEPGQYPQQPSQYGVYGQPYGGQAGQQYGQQQYGPPYGQPGYAAMPGPSGYPAPGRGRPGAVTAAAVLAFVQAGTVVMSGIGLLAGGTVLVQEFDREALGAGAEITIVALLTLAAGALLIVGGAQVFSRRSRMLVLGSVASLVLSVYFFVRMLTLGAPVGFSLVYPLMYAILPIISLSLINSGTAKAWLAPRATA